MRPPAFRKGARDTDLGSSFVSCRFVKSSEEKSSNIVATQTVTL